jgi:hypothetical protein
VGATEKSQRAESIVQTIVLVALFAAPALFCVRGACVADPDLWWHLRTGEWIVQHHAIPHFEPFTADAAGQPWAAYSWLFELIVYKLFTAFGLTGIVMYSAAMVLAITTAIHHLVRRLQRDFTFTILLTYAACFALGHLFTPRPWLFTILFAVIELDLLIEARHSGRTAPLLWLPVIFALWANVHIQFVNGLIILALAFGESVLARIQKADYTRIPPVFLGAISAACLVAVCANPYGWHLYQTAFQLATQSGVMDKITELQAIPFRSLADYVILFLALAAAAALAAARRFEPFETLLFVFAAYLSFRSQRDVWIVAISAAAILAKHLPGSEKAPDRTPFFAAPLAACGAVLAIAIGFLGMKVNQKTLTAQLEAAMPVNAVKAVQQNGYTGPLYNDFTWGGYLIWQLRQPVSLDGRQNVHGDKRIDRSVATISGQPDWAQDEELKHAGLVILPVQAPLVQLLRLDPQFKLAFEDKVAAVFVSQPQAKPSPSQTASLAPVPRSSSASNLN